MSARKPARHSEEGERASGKGKSQRGFASIEPERQREIASCGGRAAHATGHAHEFTPDEARAAGRKGGAVVSADRAHMAEIGRKGGLRRQAKRLEAEAEAQRQADSSPEPAAETVP